MLILLAALLFTGCAAERPAAGPDGGNTAATAAVHSTHPEGSASPQAGDAVATAPPSAPAGTSASPSPAAETAAPEGAAAAAAPTAVPAAAGTAPRASAPPGTGAGAATAAAGGKPAAASPSAGAKPPAATATARPAATPQATAGASAAAAPAAEAATAVISITGDEEHGVILAPAAYEIKEGETALELLKRITRSSKIQMEYQGAKAFAYVEGIDNLYEFDHGAESGWMYKVNGAFPDKGAGSYTVNPGDTIEWLYTLDLGKDLGAKAP
ncbi:DUF4430 domain-containing protein [Paenibacillus tianjinensis]|uniref:DUF4430 domain-containing protein n=2 Tax=Paenibacillus tianjinensis TaxID=2810347 RepID=A0ABX7LHM3_9BACL|nr:DUF4430 domain-containing protein [Paenibacillus tianjinensis]